MKLIMNLFLVLVLGIGSLAVLADETGPAGEVLSVKLHTTSADAYLQSHGDLVVLQSIDDQSVTYRWGGTACGSKVLTEAQASYLVELAAAPYMRIVPIHQDGQGETKCLVGFTAYNVKYE